MNVKRSKTDGFMLRFPDGMRERIKAAADANNRSMNAEIIQTLEFHYPEPITLEETVKDIKQTIALLKRFRGNSLLMHLADSLDDLMDDIAQSREGTPDDRKAVETYAWDNGKRRLPPPPDDF